MMMDELDPPVEYTPSSGNVFADLDLPDADELLAKSELVHHLVLLIRRRKLTQKDAAVLLETPQPTVSDLVRRRLDRFSLERLFGFLNRLDRDVQIVIRPKRRGRRSAALTVRTEARPESAGKAAAA
jgi:predicted XRE-type DNA-binding protein